jgi:nitrile hydratase subunit beta
VDAAVRNARSYRVDAPVSPGFAVGALVVARNINPIGATRLPRYVRGKHGTVERDYGVFVFPDSNAARLGPSPQHLYSVRFAALELWGRDANPNDSVRLDLWEDYLDRT